MGKSADSIAAREQVYHQLRDRFPKDAIEWVRTARWDPPAKIPLEEFDTQDETNWAAYHNPDHVKVEMQQYERGQNRPLVAVKLPNGRILIVDGHHRYLARERMGKDTAETYLGHVDENDGPWLYTHLSQKGGDSG